MVTRFPVLRHPAWRWAAGMLLVAGFFAAVHLIYASGKPAGAWQTLVGSPRESQAKPPAGLDFLSRLAGLFPAGLPAAPLGATPPELETVRAIFPKAQTLKPGPNPDVLEVLDLASKRLGTLVLSSPAADSIRGYGGPVPLVIGIDPRGGVAGVEFLPNWESGDYVEKVRTSGLLRRWQGRPWDQAPGLKVDTVTGATFTSRAVIQSVRRRLSLLGRQPFAPEARWEIRDWAGLVLALAAAAVCLLNLPGRNTWRLALLLLSLGYLGFFRGTFLSVDLFAHWAAHGWSWPHHGLWLAIAVMALLISWIWRRSWYCQFLCPFGAAQELIHRFTPWGVHLPPKLQYKLRFLRWALLLAAALGLAFLNVLDLTGFEPFTAFNLGVASPWVLSLAGVSLAASVFTPRPWCRFACPTGALLELLRRKK